MRGISIAFVLLGSKISWARYTLKFVKQNACNVTIKLIPMNTKFAMKYLQKLKLETMKFKSKKMVYEPFHVDIKCDWGHNLISPIVKYKF